MNHIGIKIKNLISEKRFTNREISNQLGISEPYLYNIFKNEHINTELLYKIAAVLDVDIIYFFKDDNIVSEPQTEYKTKQAGTHVFNGINNGSINITHENEMLKQKVLDLEDKLKL